jgi:hypothetical protein
MSNLCIIIMMYNEIDKVNLACYLVDARVRSKSQ